ncbi:MAG: hypothetical protein JST93_26195 [Acidobacteria bacterium]|nr:hypothetical protein [Acidobacteriota bacterium]
MTFVLNLGISGLAIWVSFKAIELAKADSLAAQQTLERLMTELRGVSVRSERTERATERLFDNQMQMVIAATLAGEQNALRRLGGATPQIAELLSTVPAYARIPEQDRKNLLDQVMTQVRASVEPQGKRTVPPVGISDLDLMEIINASENPPIAERYIQTVYQNPSLLSIDTLRSTDYESYVRVLDFLISKEVIAVQEGRLDVGPKFAAQVSAHFKKPE